MRGKRYGMGEGTGDGRGQDTIAPVKINTLSTNVLFAITHYSKKPSGSVCLGSTGILCPQNSFSGVKNLIWVKGGEWVSQTESDE